MKLNKGYWSIADFIAGITNFNGDANYNPTGQSQLLGGLQPLADLYKHFRDSVRPYKSSFYIWKDVSNPLKAAGLIMGGVFYLLAPLILLSIYAVGNKLGLTEKRPTLTQTASWMLMGALSILTGAVEIIATPLTWLRIPFRLAITSFRKNTLLPFEERPSIKKLVADANNKSSLKNTSDICFELHRKYINAKSKNDITYVNKEIEEDVFNKINLLNPLTRKRIVPAKEAVTNYLQLFKSNRRGDLPPEEEMPLLDMNRKPLSIN